MYNRFFVPVVVVALLVLFYFSYYAQLKREFIISQKQKGFVYVKVQPIQTTLGWGYEIQVDGKPYIHQEFIPAIFGRRGFDTKEDAELVGNKVVSKITNEQMSPAISIEDLKELGIKLKPSDTLNVKR